MKNKILLFISLQDDIKLSCLYLCLIRSILIISFDGDNLGLDMAFLPSSGFALTFNFHVEVLAKIHLKTLLKFVRISTNYGPD